MQHVGKRGPPGTVSTRSRCLPQPRIWRTRHARSSGNASPEGIVCLLSSLRFHELTTQIPFEVWLGIDRKARKPNLHWPPLHIVWWSDAALSEGNIAVNVVGVTIRITSPARTVADCFKYRHKIGVEQSAPSLRDVISNIKDLLLPVTAAISSNRDFNAAWPPNGPWNPRV